MKAIVWLSLLCGLLFADYGDEDALEFGGSISFDSYASHVENGGRSTRFEFMPLFNWFLVDNIYLGPRVHIGSTDGTTFWGVGATGGYAFLPDIELIPYVEGGLEFVYSESYDRFGLAIPLYGGVKIPVGDEVLLGVGVGPHIKFLNENPGADFNFSVGITFAPL